MIKEGGAAEVGEAGEARELGELIEGQLYLKKLMEVNFLTTCCATLPANYSFLDIFYDDEEEDQGLYVKDGRYGVWAKTGFQALSNFDLKIQSVVISYKHGIRGYALLATKVGIDDPIELFVPEPHIFITIK